jgi:hypothetical protein
MAKHNRKHAVTTAHVNETVESVGTMPPVTTVASAWPDTFRATFPDVNTIPGWVVPACDMIRGAWDSVPADVRHTTSFDGWLAAFGAADTTANNTTTHRYTGGSGRDIARTQNALYVAIMVAGIPYRDIKHTPFIDALWHFVIPVHACNYRERKHSFTTLAGYVRGDHNDTPGFANNRIAETAVRLWRDAKPAADVPAAS